MSQFKLPSCCAKCLAAEPTATWQVGAEEVISEKDKMTSILHAVQIPLCRTCHRQLRLQCVLYWVVGLLVSAVTAAAIAHFGPPLLANVTDIPIGVLILGLVAFVIMTAWVTAWGLREKFVQSRLAKYDPTAPRLAFGNKQYQELFDRANDILHTRSFGV